MFTAIVATTLIRVLVIDTPVIMHKDFGTRVRTDAVRTNHMHGTHITGLILSGGYKEFIFGFMRAQNKVCDRVIIDTCSIDKDYTMTKYMKCLKKAKDGKYNYVNISLSGEGTTEEEYKLYLDITNNGTKVIVAAGNTKTNIQQEKVYPASLLYRNLKNFFVVGANDTGTSSYGKGVVMRSGIAISTVGSSSYTRMQGSSVAAPLFLNELLRKECSNETLQTPVDVGNRLGLDFI